MVAHVELSLVLSVVLGSAGTAAALLAVVAMQLSGDERTGWLGLALGSYCVLSVPVSVLATVGVAPEAVLDASRFGVNAVVGVLLLITVLAPPWPRRGQWWAVAVVLVVLVVAATSVWGAGAPTVATAVTGSPVFRLALAAGWTALSVAMAVTAAWRRSSGLWSMWTGVAVLGTAHAWRAVHVTVPADVGLPFAILRLLGVGAALCGSLVLARQAIAERDREQARQEEGLRAAEQRLAHAAERDHELRNGLAGLAGAATLLHSERPDALALERAVAAELSRLEDLLQSTAGDGFDPEPYRVGAVLHDQVALRAAAGVDVRLDADAHLLAVGSPRTLVQVVGNLLTNAERHAPGSPVRITALRHDASVVVRVRDFGPGVVPGSEEAVFAAGTRDPRAGGLGLGLAVSRRLLAGEGASIEVRPFSVRAPGCVVVVTLPAATRGERVDDARRLSLLVPVP